MYYVRDPEGSPCLLGAGRVATDLRKDPVGPCHDILAQQFKFLFRKCCSYELLSGVYPCSQLRCGSGSFKKRHEYLPVPCLMIRVFQQFPGEEAREGTADFRIHGLQASVHVPGQHLELSGPGFIEVVVVAGDGVIVKNAQGHISRKVGEDAFNVKNGFDGSRRFLVQYFNGVNQGGVVTVIRPFVTAWLICSVAAVTALAVITPPLGQNLGEFRCVEQLEREAGENAVQ